MKRFAILAGCLLATTSFAARWTFVVTGDGRTNDKTPDMTGVNSAVMTKLVAAIKAEHPKFLVWTGDLVHGVYNKITTPIDQQFANWLGIMKPLSGVDILPVRGNHEQYGDKDGTIWLRMLKPLMDKSHVSYFSGESGYSYSYVPRNDKKMTLIAVDQFIQDHRVNLAELERALKKAKSGGAKNIFVFAHEMAFTCTNHPDTDNMAAFKPERNAFLDLLQKYGVRYFFAGHDHAYDWMTIKNSRWPAEYELNQIVA